MPKPVYPRLAEIARVQGAVVIEINISTTGSVKAPKLVSGPPLLGQAVMDAVQRWQYKPHVIGGAAIEVQTTINFLFSYDSRTNLPTVEAGVPDARMPMQESTVNTSAGPSNDGHRTGKRPPVFQAATVGDSSAMLQLLNEDSQQVHAVDELGKQPLHYAAQFNHKEIAELLIAHGADVNAADRFGMTPLHLAAIGGYKDIVDILVAAHADVNLKTADGMTPLFLASANHHEDAAAVLRSQGGAEPDIPIRVAPQSTQATTAHGSSSPPTSRRVIPGSFDLIDRIAVLPLVDAREEKRESVNLEKVRESARKLLESKHYAVSIETDPPTDARFVLLLKLTFLNRTSAAIAGVICDRSGRTSDPECPGRGSVFWADDAKESYLQPRANPNSLSPTNSMQMAASEVLTDAIWVSLGLSKGDAENHALYNMMLTIPKLKKKKHP